jgi:hypothetical protein
MTIAPDASTQSAQFSTVSPFTFSHTLAAGSIGAVVRISHAQDDIDHITGAVTVGGVALTRVASKGDLSVERRRVECTSTTLQVFQLGYRRSRSPTTQAPH